MDLNDFMLEAKKIYNDFVNDKMLTVSPETKEITEVNRIPFKEGEDWFYLAGRYDDDKIFVAVKIIVSPVENIDKISEKENRLNQL